MDVVMGLNKYIEIKITIPQVADFIGLANASLR